MEIKEISKTHEHFLPPITRFVEEHTAKYELRSFNYNDIQIQYTLPSERISQKGWYENSICRALDINSHVFAIKPQRLDYAFVSSTEDFNYFFPHRKTKGDYQTGRATGKQAIVLTPEAIITDSSFSIHRETRHAPQFMQFTLVHETAHLFTYNLTAPHTKKVPQWLHEGITYIAVPRKLYVPRKESHTYSDRDIVSTLENIGNIPTDEWLKKTFLGRNEGPIIYAFANRFVPWILDHYPPYTNLVVKGFHEGWKTLTKHTFKTSRQKNLFDFLNRISFSKGQTFEECFEEHFGLSLNEAYKSFLIDLKKRNN